MSNIKISELTELMSVDGSEELPIVSSGTTKKVAVDTLLAGVSLVESDPVFTAWDKSTGISITESQISDLQSYLTAETDPVFTAWDKSTGISITESQISDFGSYEPANANIQSHISSTSNPHSTTALQTGGDYLHGVETAGILSFVDGTRTFTVSNVTYWYQGTQVSNISPSIVIPNTQGLWYISFNSTSGTLTASQTPWSLTTNVPVATVFWNGSVGAVGNEQHGYRRDLQWHNWCHNTVGTRYASGLTMTAPSVASPSTINFSSGSVWDEDLQITINSQTNCRIFYQTGASAYTFINSSTPYPTTVSYVNSSTYVLTDVGGTNYINMWAYASNDKDIPIYFIVETVATPYANVTQARAATPPNLAGLGLTPELKLLYRIIYQGNDTFAEATDYRNSSVLPAGGTASSSAASVSFAPSGNIASTNVQSAIEELDAEKQPLDAQLTSLAGLSYTDNAGKVIAVNATTDGFELVTPTGGTNSDWQSYTPVWTAETTPPSLGNGTLVASYRYVDAKTVKVRITLVFGSTTNRGAGIYHFSLPPGMTHVANSVYEMGSAYILDSGTNYRIGATVCIPGDTTVQAVFDSASSFLSATVPITLTTGDYIVMNVELQIQ